MKELHGIWTELRQHPAWPFKVTVSLDHVKAFLFEQVALDRRFWLGHTRPMERAVDHNSNNKQTLIMLDLQMISQQSINSNKR
jgi:hypothetical protein